MTFLEQVAQDPRRALADLERKLGVEPGGLVREMNELVDDPADWESHLSFGIARDYFEDAKTRERFEEHVNGCRYCKGLLDAAHPTSTQVADFVRAAKGRGTRRTWVRKVTPFTLTAGIVILTIGAWLLF
jgi:hypothetical protein